MVVVDCLDEWLDLRPFRLTSFRHTAGNLRRVALDACNKGMRERVCLAAGIKRLNDYNLGNMMSVFHVFCIDDLGYWNVELERSITFLPAYRPRVMIATRPTLRTREVLH